MPNSTIESKEFFGLMRDFLYAHSHNKNEEAYRAVIAHIDKEMSRKDSTINTVSNALKFAESEAAKYRLEASSVRQENARIVAATVEACIAACNSKRLKAVGNNGFYAAQKFAIDDCIDAICAIQLESIQSNAAQSREKQ